MSALLSSAAETGTAARRLRTGLSLLSDGPLLGAGSQALYGPQAAPQPILSVPTPTLIAALQQAGLDGRGGGGFPAWRKLDSIVRAGGSPRVIANLSEGEPWSAKDHALAWFVPHLVLDGLALIGNATETRRVDVVAAPDLYDTLTRAISSRPDRGRFRMHEAGSGFPSGEASAVAEIVASHGRRTVPRFHALPLTAGEPRGAGMRGAGMRGAGIRGAGKHPTLVHNAETLAWIALIARHGADWYRQYGTRLGTITGDVPRPGVFEAGPIALSTIVALAGSAPVSSGPAGGTAGIGGTAGTASRAAALDPCIALVGGYAGGWIESTAWDTTAWDTRALQPARAQIGPGIIHVLDSRRCPLALTARVLATLAAESAGQCGPCVFGLPALAEAFAQATRPGSRPSDIARARQLAALVAGRGACHHPDGAAALALASLDGLETHWALHRAGRCHAHA